MKSFLIILNCSNSNNNKINNSLAASTSVYHEEGEETEAALELSECIAESLMDHFTERGLLAKEIKVMTDESK